MNQTAWILGGGVVVIVLAGWLYMMSGDSTQTIKITNDEPYKMDVSGVSTTPVTDNTGTTITTTTTTTTTTMTPTPATEPAKPTPPATASGKKVSTATIHTSMGDITVDLYPMDAPKTVENFAKLASSGFYDGVKFHRVIKGFMIQTGDPLSKDDTKSGAWGSGGPGYKFADEINAQSPIYLKGYKHGVLAMANSGPNTNGSQFFIMAADYPLPPLYTIFGEVTSGLSVVDAIDAVATDGNDRPLSPVTISSVKVQ